jgi:hypothetical protein
MAESCARSDRMGHPDPVKSGGLTPCGLDRGFVARRFVTLAPRQRGEGQLWVDKGFLGEARRSRTLAAGHFDDSSSTFHRAGTIL